LFEAYIPDWKAAVVDAAANLPKYKQEVERGLKFENLSLGALAQITHRLGEEDKIPRTDVEGMLGDRWVVDLETFASSIRNPLAHGATFTDAFRRNFLDNWRSRAQLLCRI